jgi:hypothetical protein
MTVGLLRGWRWRPGIAAWRHHRRFRRGCLALGRSGRRPFRSRLLLRDSRPLPARTGWWCGGLKFRINRVRLQAACGFRVYRHSDGLVAVECEGERYVAAGSHSELARGTAGLSGRGPGVGARRLGFDPQHLRRRPGTEIIEAWHRHRACGEGKATCQNGNNSAHGWSRPLRRNSARLPFREDHTVAAAVAQLQALTIPGHSIRLARQEFENGCGKVCKPADYPVGAKLDYRDLGIAEVDRDDRDIGGAGGGDIGA